MDSETEAAVAEEGMEAPLPEHEEIDTELVEDAADEEESPAPLDEEEEEEEFELEDGLTLRLPAEQARKLREGWLRQKDYTRKTQELAERRKSFETDRDVVMKATNDELEAFAALRNLQGQLDQFQKVDWAGLHERNALQALKMHMQYMQARDAMNAAQARFDTARNDRLSSEQQTLAKLMEEGRAVLTRDIGWNDELKARLIDHALQRGLSRDDMSDLEANPVAAKILKDAYEWAQHQSKTQAAKRLTQAQQAKPAATVSARRAPPTGLDDRLPAKEWVKRRNNQLRKRG